MNDALSILGLAKKAGKLELGEEACGAAARAKHAKVIAAAGDAAENTLRRAKYFADIGNTHLVVTHFTKEEIGRMVGRNSCALAAICDPGFASAFVTNLAKSDGNKYGVLAADLRDRAERYEKRKREKRAHEKNKRKN